MIETFPSGTRSQIGPSGIHRQGLRVRGSGTSFNPASITGLQAWFKVDAGTSTTTDGVGISQWNDQSGNGRHAVQATGGNQPLYKTAIQNGLPGVLFNGGTQLMNTSAFTVAQPDTIFAVGKSLVATLSHNLFDGVVTRQALAIGATVKWGMNAGSDTETTTPADTAAHTFSCVYNGASSLIYLDGTALSALSPGANSLNTLRIGSFDGTAGGAWNGYVFEILVYDSNLSTANRQAVEAYLKAKYGL